MTSRVVNLAAHRGSAWTAAAVTAVLAARHEHTHAALSPITRSPTQHDWNDVIDAIRRHRVVALIAPHADALGLPGPSVERLRTLRERHVRRGLALQRDTATVSSLLSVAGIDHLVVKGVMLAALTGDDAASRGAGDVDVWVRPTDAPHASAALRTAGYTSDAKLGEVLDTVGWRRRVLLSCFPEMSLVHESHATVDLHWRLTNAPNEMSFDFDVAYRRSTTISIAGVEVRTLCPPDALEHIAHHGRKEGWPALRQLVDVERLVERCSPAVAHDLARRDRDVALALGVTSYVAPWVCDHAVTTARTTRLSRHAWTRCMSLATGPQVNSQLEGRARLTAIVRHRLWILRSASSWRSRAHVFVLLIALPDALLEPAPPVVSYPRYIARTARSLIAKRDR